MVSKHIPRNLTFGFEQKKIGRWKVVYFNDQHLLLKDYTFQQSTFGRKKVIQFSDQSSVVE